jgi:hypothetical protein
MARPANESALPFPPYGSLVNFLNDLNAMEVLPNQLNQQVFAPTYSGSSRVQIIRAFKFFDLTTETNGFNLDRLRPLMNPDTRADALAALLCEKYAALIALPLATAGPAEFNKWFNDVGMDPATTRKAKSFFMTAAKENGIKMHSLVADRVATRRGPSSPRKKRGAGKKRDGDDEQSANNNADSLLPPGFDPVLAGLLKNVPDFQTVAELDEWYKVFKATFGYVKARTKNKAQADT